MSFDVYLRSKEFDYSGVIESSSTTPRRNVVVHGSDVEEAVAGGYGSDGKKTVQKMCKLLRSSGLGVSYDPSSLTFIVHGPLLSKRNMEKILYKGGNYSGHWAPYVLEEVDKNGNRLVRLSDQFLYTKLYLELFSVSQTESKIC